MCYVLSNPKGLLTHVEELMHVVEESADDNEIQRILNSLEYHIYEDELNDVEYETKWNAVFEALTSFVKFVSKRQEEEYLKSKKRNDSKKEKIQDAVEVKDKFMEK